MMFCAGKCLCGSSVFTLVLSKRELKYVLVVGALCSNLHRESVCLFICFFVYLSVCLFVYHSLTFSLYTTGRKMHMQHVDKHTKSFYAVRSIVILSLDCRRMCDGE